MKPRLFMLVGGRRKKCIAMQKSVVLESGLTCLKDTETGEIKETVVFRIESRSFLKKFNEKNGWGIDWIEVPNDVDVFALALKENNEIQGLVGVRNDNGPKAAYLHWACTAPHNNKRLYGTQRYSGVGGIFLLLPLTNLYNGAMMALFSALPLTMNS